MEDPTGSYSKHRLLVCLQGRQLFEHPVIHANQLTTRNLELAKDKHVIVIGSGKSAVDAAVAASEVAASVTNVFRKVLAICQHASSDCHAWICSQKDYSPML